MFVIPTPLLLITLLIQTCAGFFVQRNVEDKSCPLAKTCTVRTYYISIDEVDWDYAPSGMDRYRNKPIVQTDASVYLARYTNRIGGVYVKARYLEYETAKFVSPLRTEPWMGILGPMIRAEVGDVVKVVLRNNATRPFGIHPHGVIYSKMDESAAYYNQTSMAGVPSGSTYNFTWIIAERSGPGPNDGNATLWGYHSHLQDPGDIYSGLVGGFVIYNKGVLDPVTHFPTDVDEEFLLNFMVYNENLSPYLYASIKKFAPELSDRLLSNPKTPFTIPGVTWTESNKMHSVNGRMFGNLDGLDVGVGKRVRWHIMAFGTEWDIHTVHWHSQTVLMSGHRVDVIELLPATFRTAEAIVDNPGIWILHCHVVDHQIAGMGVFYRITNPNDPPSLNLAGFQTSKIDMSAPPALRPGRAEAATAAAVNKSSSVSLALLLLIVLSAFIL